MGVKLANGEEQRGLNYADGFGQHALDRLVRTVVSLGTCLPPSNCEMLFKDWTIMDGEQLTIIDHFYYFVCCVMTGDSTMVEVSTRASQAWRRTVG